MLSEDLRDLLALWGSNDDLLMLLLLLLFDLLSLDKLLHALVLNQ